MMEKQIYLDQPNIGRLEKEYIGRCIDSTFVSTHGPFVSEFEERFARILGCRSAVSVQSGTAGLHMALYELGIGEGDEVIVPVLSFVATVNAIKYVGAVPVFAEVDLSTWNLDTDRLCELITPRTRAIIPVHIYGNPCEMDEISNLAMQYNLYVIEDATESLYSKYNGRFAGTFGDFGIFSFNGNKLITTGGGGMIVGSDERRLEHIKFLINQARDEEKGYFHHEIGFNLRMTNLEASLGLAQIKRFDEFLKKKRLFREIYVQAFENIDEVQLQQKYDKSETLWWLNSIIIDTDKIGNSIPEIQAELKRNGIATRRIFMPLVEFPPYFEKDKGRYPYAYRIYERGLTLPGSTLNSERDIKASASALINLL
jgi:perosamine synthetase